MIGHTKNDNMVDNRVSMARQNDRQASAVDLATADGKNSVDIRC